MSRCKLKYQRQRREYNRQCARLAHYETRFRKIARKQVQERALRKLARLQQEQQQAQAENTENAETSDDVPDANELVRRGVKSLQMTPELCGLFDQINRIRSMLYLAPHAHGYDLLLR